MATARRIVCFYKNKHLYLKKSSSFYSTKTNLKEDTGQKEIIIPYRIERGPTDILKALASTISRDRTAAHYKYEDDPYFMPASNITKRTFALSKESGKKAARYFLEKYPELFKCNKSVPHVKAFDPPITYTENNKVTEEILKECIKNYDVKNCIDIFNILKKKDISISQGVKQDLLDLLCFYNNTPPLPEDYYEERFFQRIDEFSVSKWNSKGLAEQLFESMEKDGRAYSAMIAGLAMHGDAERALQLHNEMKSKQIIGTVHAYNSLIGECNRIHEDSASAWELAIHLSHQMDTDGLKADLYTMNAFLKILSKAMKWRKARLLSLNVMSEMKRLKIEPSLGTYYYLLKIYSLDPAIGGVLMEILPLIEDKEHEIRHPSDVLFFSNAMEMCWRNIHDKELAYRLHKLLEYKQNSKLLGNALSESQYFKCFFRLLSEVEEIDTFMELYDKYIPNTYTPEPMVTLSIIQAIHFTGAYKHLPRLCSDVLMFEQTERGNILEALLEAAACTKNEKHIQKPLVDMVWNIVDNLNNRAKNRRLQFDWTGVMFGNILKTFINGKDLEKSWVIIEKLQDEAHLILGSPEKAILLEFCQLCLEVEDYDKMVGCVKYAVKGEYPNFNTELITFVNDLIKEEKLDENVKSVLVDRIGSTMFDGTLDKSSSSDSSSDSSGSDSNSDDEIYSSSDEENTEPKSKS